MLHSQRVYRCNKGALEDHDEKRNPEKPKRKRGEDVTREEERVVVVGVTWDWRAQTEACV